MLLHCGLLKSGYLHRTLDQYPIYPRSYVCIDFLLTFTLIQLHSQNNCRHRSTSKVPMLTNTFNLFVSLHSNNACLQKEI